MATIIKAADRAALRKWEGFLDGFLSTVVVTDTETPEEQKKRIAKLEKNFEEWKKYYFPQYCYAPPAPFHIKASKRILKSKEWYECRAWTREAAKDVVTMMETIYQVVKGIKKSIILVSNSYDNAEKLLAPYKLTLENNERIINDYGLQKQPGNWTSGDFITLKGASFIAVGIGQSPRGTRNEAVRPDKIIVSDVETDKDVRNPEIVKQNWEWIEDALIPTRGVSKPLQIIFLNNIIAKDCCMVRAMKKADHAEIINLVDKNGNSTWPEKNKPEHIARIRRIMSTRAFQKEYMNNPLTEGKVFKKMVWGKVPALSRFKRLIVYADPSNSNKDRTQVKTKGVSYKALFLMGELDGYFYVIHGYLDQVPIATFVNWFFDIRKRINKNHQINFHIENNSLQNPFYEQVFKPLFFSVGKERGFIPVTPDERQKPDKFVRIEGNLEPLNRDGQLILNEKEKENPHFQELEEQFLLVDEKLSSAADGPDCVEGGYFILNGNTNEAIEQISITGRGASKKY
uniref:hypothetical protein n=1 Tax=uncultured Draconibacterium sp. TaxID=1573823 RepID=UPI00321740E4